MSDEIPSAAAEGQNRQILRRGEQEEESKRVRVMIRYKIKRDHLDRELELLRAIYEELEATQPDGLRYASFQLDDGVSFVEFAETDGPGRFSTLRTFRTYRTTLDERCDEPPVVTELHEVGAFPGAEGGR